MSSANRQKGAEDSPLLLTDPPREKKLEMSSAAAIMHSDTAGKPVAPWWHTVLVLVPIAIASVASAYQHGLPNANVPGLSSRLSGYFTVIAGEWFLVLLIWLALRRRGLSIRSLVSGRWPTFGTFFKDLGFAVGFIVVGIPLLSGLMRLFGGHTTGTLVNILPRTGFELLVWLRLSATGSFCEELIFRGYLTLQFRAWTDSRAFGVVLQAVAFGLAHGYYRKVMVAVMIYGLLLGLLAHWRESLRPGILAHGLQDTLGGVVAFFS